MGLESSGDVSDIAFYELAEKPFACRQDVIDLYKVKLYPRFRDDIVVILACDAPLYTARP